MIKLLSFLIGLIIFLLIAFYKVLKNNIFEKVSRISNVESRKRMLEMNQIKAKTHEEIQNMDDSTLNNRL